MANNRFSKPVAFNHTNPEDQRILRHIENLNFSGYVKELIFADIAKREDQEKYLKIKKQTEKGGVKIIINPR